MPPDSGAPLAGSSRSTPGPLLWITAALLLARIGTGVYENRHPPPPADLVQWRPIEGAVASARSLGRPILYDFTADWCSPCRLMAREVFAARQAAGTISGMFVPVRVLDRMREEGRNPPDVAALQARYKVGAFPTLVIVSPDGGEPVVIEGYPGRAELTKRLMSAGLRTQMNVRLGPRGVKVDTTR